jgi:hypothetical protein
MTSNRPGPTELLWRLIELRALVDDQLAQQYLAAAVRRLTVLRDDALMRGPRS